MAEEIPERAEDLKHLPDPALGHKHKIKGDVVFVTREQDIKDDIRRVWITFRRAAQRYWAGHEPEDKDAHRKLFDHKVAMYISQAGKWGLVWMDDKFWRIVRKKRLAKETTRFAAKMLKLDVRPLNIEEEREEALRECIAEML